MPKIYFIKKILLFFTILIIIIAGIIVISKKSDKQGTQGINTIEELYRKVGCSYDDYKKDKERVISRPTDFCLDTGHRYKMSFFCKAQREKGVNLTNVVVLDRTCEELLREPRLSVEINQYDNKPELLLKNIGEYVFLKEEINNLNLEFSYRYENGKLGEGLSSPGRYCEFCTKDKGIEQWTLEPKDFGPEDTLRIRILGKWSTLPRENEVVKFWLFFQEILTFKADCIFDSEGKITCKENNEVFNN